LILLIDTCLAACQVGLADSARLVASTSEPMERGHQERLAPMAAEVMARARVSFDQVRRIAVTLGPGSFTGLRVGLAFAKGLSLATGAPLVGVGTLEALAASAGVAGRVVAVIDARRDNLYWQAFNDGAPLALPAADSTDEVARQAPKGSRIAGPAASLFGARLPAAERIEMPAPSLEALARLAAAAEPGHEVRPIYLRAAVAPPP
jgi:tRNA threonylcarbamoyladenosine biosynthesis protein TsaB